MFDKVIYKVKDVFWNNLDVRKATIMGITNILATAVGVTIYSNTIKEEKKESETKETNE